ncbi:hypothetical protein BH10ACT7_BH10ACT7_28130 [soil metagenome]
MTPAEHAFDDLADSLVPQGASRAKMMGRPMLSLGGKMFACLNAGMLGLKLGAGTESHTAALAVPGAVLFSPGKDRVFKDWVSLPVEQEHEWERFAVEAMEKLS